MSGKKDKDRTIPVSQEDNVQAQRLLTQFHNVAQDLRKSAGREQAEAALTPITSTSEGAQVALLKALSKEPHVDAADVLLAINTLSPNKEIRKEARRSLIRLEGSKIYPRWTPPITQPFTLELPGNPARFWKGMVTQTRDVGEVQLMLFWEQGPDYNEARMLGFLLEFWHDGVKDFFTRVGSKRRIEAEIEEMTAHYRDVDLTDCTLAEGRQMIREALAVNKLRGTKPHKDYQRNLSLVNQLVLEAPDPDTSPVRTFLDLNPMEVVIHFVEGWARGDYSMAYNLLSTDSSIREGLSRDEWIERRRKWAAEAHPVNLRPGFIHEREARKSGLWLPTPILGKKEDSQKELEAAWSLELTDTDLGSTLKELPMATIVYTETGRHWFWTSYTLVKEQNEWRIQNMTDEGAVAQSLSASELEKRLDEIHKRLEILTQQQNMQNPEEADEDELADALEEVIKSTTRALHYDDARITKLPSDVETYKQAYLHAMITNSFEHAAAYLEQIAERFPEERAEALKHLALTQHTLSDIYYESDDADMDERGEHFAELAEANIRKSLTLVDDADAHLVLAEILIEDDERLDEAEEHLHQADALFTEDSDKVNVQNLLGDIAVEREEYEQALSHYQRATELDPDSSESWYNLGHTQKVLSQMEDALASLERAIELDPENESAYAELAAVYTDEGDLEKARETLEEGLDQIGDSAMLLATLSLVLFQSGEINEAREVLEEAEEIDPEMPLVRIVRQLIDTTIQHTRPPKPKKKPKKRR